MKHLKKVVILLLNALFCIATIWLFARNSFLRPYAGSFFKEFLAALLLLGSLYANYFLIYPKLYLKYPHIFYWLTVVLVVMLTALADMAIAHRNIVFCVAPVIQQVGSFNFFSNILFLIFGRNLAMNFFPFLFRERKELQQSLEREVKIVYEYARLLDVCDKDNNCQHIPIDDIYYCKKNGNDVVIYKVNGMMFTRYCSLKYLAQHFGDKEFIRISSSIIVPFQYIDSCDGKAVVMKKMPWTDTPLTFDLDLKTSGLIADVIVDHLRAAQENADNVPSDSSDKETVKRNPSIPPQDKLDAVFRYIQANPSCRSTEIDPHTSFSLSTIERCLSELKKQGLIEYAGTKKNGGYHIIDIPQENVETEATQQEETVSEKTENNEDFREVTSSM